MQISGDASLLPQLSHNTSARREDAGLGTRDDFCAHWHHVLASSPHTTPPPVTGSPSSVCPSFLTLQNPGLVPRSAALTLVIAKGKGA